MNWRKIIGIVGAGIIMAATGCFSVGPRTSPADQAMAAAEKRLGSVAGISFGVLDTIAVLAALGAAATLVAWGFGMPIRPKLTIALVLTTVGAWVLKALLVKFFWIILILSILGILLTGAVFAYGHVDWLERRLNRDINKDGKVG